MDNEKNLQRSLDGFQERDGRPKSEFDHARSGQCLRTENRYAGIHRSFYCRGLWKTKARPRDANGRILTVGLQPSFVIVSLGYTSGIRLDHLLEIERNGESIA